jgi:acyl carrier protein
MEIPRKLKEYIDNQRGSLPPVTDPDEPLHLDSLSVIRLLAFLENELGCRVEDEQIIQKTRNPSEAGRVTCDKNTDRAERRSQSPGLTCIHIQPPYEKTHLTYQSKRLAKGDLCEKSYSD